MKIKLLILSNMEMELWSKLVHEQNQTELGNNNFTKRPMGLTKERFQVTSRHLIGWPLSSFLLAFPDWKCLKGRTLCVKRLLPTPCDIKPTGPPQVTMETGATVPPIPEHPDPLNLPYGGCTNQNSDLEICATQCDGENYGRSMVSRQMFRPVFINLIGSLTE